MKLVYFFLALVTPAVTQTSVTDVMTTQKLALTSSVSVLNIIAVQGDGSSCRISKNQGGQINLSLACLSGDGKTNLSGITIRQSGVGTYQTLPFGFGDIFCLLGINPTAATVTAGSLGNTPVNGITWACTTNIAVNGVITGQTAIVSGTAVWP